MTQTCPDCGGSGFDDDHLCPGERSQPPEYPTKPVVNPYSGKQWIDEGRLIEARRAAAYAAWLDLFSRFDDKQRRMLANLLAHKWHIASVTIKNTEEGRNSIHTISVGDQT